MYRAIATTSAASSTWRPDESQQVRPQLAHVRGRRQALEPRMQCAQTLLGFHHARERPAGPGARRGGDPGRRG